MSTRAELALALLASAHELMAGHLRNLTLEEALSAAGGHRSILGILKHTAGWSHVYYSYACEPEPRHWARIDWPRGLRDTIDPSTGYLAEIERWLALSHERWRAALAGLDDEALERARPCHWGATAPLFELVGKVAHHCVYHAGELNAVLAIVRGEAWEYTEEVEENHISTVGHRLRPEWMSEEQARSFETYIAARDAELHGMPGG